MEYLRIQERKTATSTDRAGSAGNELGSLISPRSFLSVLPSPLPIVFRPVAALP